MLLRKMAATAWLVKKLYVGLFLVGSTMGDHSLLHLSDAQAQSSEAQNSEAQGSVVQGWYERTENVMGTRASIRFYLPGAEGTSKENSNDEQEANSAVDSSAVNSRASTTDETNQHKATALLKAGFAEFERINQLWSPYIESSELSRINEARPGPAIPITKESFALLSDAQAYSTATKGAFDITIYTLSQHFDYSKQRKPNQSERARASRSMGSDFFKLDDTNGFTLTKKRSLKIDLGGIAKGYAVDQVIRILSQAGVTQALVSAGGDSRALGDNLGKGWWVGIKKPRGKGIALRFPVADSAFSTSGDYERYYIDPQTGAHIHHIIDPKSGASASSVTSSTVLGPQGKDTDALSTSIFVLGVKKGLSLIESMPGFEAIMIDAFGVVHYSSGLAPPAP